MKLYSDVRDPRKNFLINLGVERKYIILLSCIDNNLVFFIEIRFKTYVFINKQQIHCYKSKNKFLIF